MFSTKFLQRCFHTALLHSGDAFLSLLEQIFDHGCKSSEKLFNFSAFKALRKC